MSEPAQPLDGDDISRPRRCIAQRVERRDPGAHQWRRFGEVQTLGHRRDGNLRSDDEFLVASVKRYRGDARIAAVDETAGQAAIAGPVVATVPSEPDSVSDPEA